MTTDEIMALADEYANIAVSSHIIWNTQMPHVSADELRAEQIRRDQMLIDTRDALQSAIEALREEADRPDSIDEMPAEQAMHLADLWRAGKLIGGDAHSACVSLLGTIEALQADAARYRWIRDRRGCPFAETDEAWDVPEIFERDIDAAMALDKP